MPAEHPADGRGGAAVPNEGGGGVRAELDLSGVAADGAAAAPGGGASEFRHPVRLLSFLVRAERSNIGADPAGGDHSRAFE